MKKRVLIMALAFMLVFISVLTACGSKGDLSGTYTCKVSGVVFSTITFKGNDITVEYPNSGNVSTGTYKLDGNKISISWDGGKKDTYTYNASDDSIEWMSFVWEKD